MQPLFKKCCVGIMLASVISIVHADAGFSHIVLRRLPNPPPNLEPWSVIINNQEEWQHFYTVWQNDFSPVLTAPKVDFEKYQLVAGGLGLQSSNGYSVVVDRVYEFDDGVEISVLEVSPGAKCRTTTGMTSPSTAILITRTSKPLRFSITKLTGDCAS